MNELTLDELIAIGERLDGNDSARAWRLALEVAGSEAEAEQLLAEAATHAEAMIARPGFRAAAERVAAELLRRRELRGDVLDQFLYAATNVDWRSLPAAIAIVPKQQNPEPA